MDRNQNTGETESEQVKSVKVVINKEIRRVGIDYFEGATADWDEFIRRLTELFAGTPLPASFSLRYVDNDGDSVTASSAMELEEAFRTHVKTLNITLVKNRCKPPKNTTTTTEQVAASDEPEAATLPRALGNVFRKFGAYQAATQKRTAKWFSNRSGGMASWWNSWRPLRVIEQANKLRETGDIQGALAALEEAMHGQAQLAHHAGIHYTYACTLAASHKYDQAAHELATAVALGYTDLKELLSEPTLYPLKKEALPNVALALILNMQQNGNGLPGIVENAVNKVVVELLDSGIEECVDNARIACQAGVAAFPNDPVMWYNLACIDCLQHNLGDAATHLTAAINNGYAAWEHIMEDPDLVALRESPEWPALSASLIKKDKDSTIMRMLGVQPKKEETPEVMQFRPIVPPLRLNENQPQEVVEMEDPVSVPDPEDDDSIVEIATPRTSPREDVVGSAPLEPLSGEPQATQEPTTIPGARVPLEPLFNPEDEESDQERDYVFDDSSSVTSLDEEEADSQQTLLAGAVDPKLQTLVDMGFNKSVPELEALLAQYNGNINAAIGVLVNFH